MKFGYPQADYVWIATDAVGRIAAFATGGEGPIPTAVMHSACIPIARIENVLLQMPIRGEATMLRKYSRPDTFMSLGKRGLYVFDWTDVHKMSAAEIGAYELVCAPSVPILYSELSHEFLRHFASLPAFKVNFEGGHAIDPTAQTSCILPGEKC